MRGSYPIPRTTSRTSACTASHRLAIAFTKEIFVARNAFDAYLIISADAGSVTSTGAWISRYTADTRTATSVSSQPMTTRCGASVSRTACPSRRNSGFDATPTSVTAPADLSARATASVEPTGIVDLLTTTVPGRSTGAISRATPSTTDRSAAPLSDCGVCTQMNTNSAPAAASCALDTNRNRPDCSPSRTSAGRPSSRIGTSPFDSPRTRASSRSAQTT